MAAALQEQYEEPPFKGIHDALKFALNFKHGNTKEPTIARFQKANHAGRGFGGLDGAAQAGMILQELDSMGFVTEIIESKSKKFGKREVVVPHPERKALLVARFTEQGVTCDCENACCSGHRPNPRWLVAVKELSEYVLPYAGGRISHQRLRLASVMRYFGVRKSFREIAARCGITADTASAHHNKVVQCLGGLEKIARYEIEDRLRKGGVIE